MTVECFHEDESVYSLATGIVVNPIGGKMQSKVRLIARFAIIAALVVTGYSIDALISSSFPIRIAWVVLVVSLTIMQQFGWGTALYTGTVFGLVSLLFSFMLPNVTSPAFQMPWISVLPRMLIGITCSFSLSGLLRVSRNRKSLFMRELLPRSVSGIVGVFTNTIFVLGMIAVTNGESIMNKIISVVISVNFIPEFIIGLLLVPTISYALRGQIKKMRI